MGPMILSLFSVLTLGACSASRAPRVAVPSTVRPDHWAPLVRRGPYDTVVEGVETVVWDILIPETMARDLVGSEVLQRCQERLRDGHGVVCFSIIRPCTRLEADSGGYTVQTWAGYCGTVDPTLWRVGVVEPGKEPRTEEFRVAAETVPILRKDVAGAWVYQ